ncbi:PASTA domain-containing penicillin-binding protein [Cohnella lubricantis]|uniref:PASTA domain-containing protein n=1 Tax=Cohnella lubricantis TaxID=2163172 RepID=A0A841TB60_9BACL|nr:PASTA domain-containing penicillin-binding protein [Cohnella lubricantis]MBB6677326.1 PASTA domain-containing protein [Cohnella lubricantis]MBP2116862.1 penicillin-binding protein 2B [Cohnella lubricantis]
MTRRIRIRTLLLGGLLTLLFVGLIVHIYLVQVAHGPFWAEQARKTWITSKPLPQERGTIYDRDGKVLAADASAYTVAVSPKKIHALEAEHPEWRLLDQIVSKLHLVLDKPENEVRDIVNAQKDGGYYDQREVRPEGWKIDKEVADRLIAFKDELSEQTGKSDIGLYFIEEQKRYYPKNSLASQVLGYEDKDGIPRMGLEKTLNDVLQGQPGKITYEKDGIRTQLAGGELEVQQPVDGKDVTTTIDTDIQFYMEEAVRAAYAEYNPVSITAIAADPKTMDILGMVSLPDFNPNEYWEDASNLEAFKNNAIQSVYEPGSTFKIVTLAAAVQEGLFHPDEYYQSGSISISSKDKPIHDSNYSGWGKITFLEGLKHSSNVAFVKLGYEMLGKDKFKEYINNFGFGVKTGIELQGEVVGSPIPVWNRDWAAATFGQAVTVTPLQQVAAVAAVANGGKLMKPHLVKSITDPATGEKTVTQPEVVRQVISEETSRQVGEYLEQVVSDKEIGTGRNAYIPGYRIAGKTGTAQVYGSDGKILSGQYVVSFIGYAPVEDPKIVLYVLVDRPEDEYASGGGVVAPIFKQIMGQSLLHLGVMPKVEEDAAGKDNQNSDNGGAADEHVTAAVPDVTGMTIEQAKNELKNHSFTAQTLGEGARILQQVPRAGTMLPTSQSVFLVTETKGSAGSVPDMQGMSLRDALEMCALLGVSCTAEGEGYVVSQQTSSSGGKTAVALTLAPAGAKAEDEDEASSQGEDTDSAGNGEQADKDGAAAAAGDDSSG